MTINLHRERFRVTNGPELRVTNQLTIFQIAKVSLQSLICFQPTWMLTLIAR